MDNRRSGTDVLVVGSGLAGTYLALNLPKHLNITILSSYDDNSSLAQGGIASCVKKEDSFDAHVEDTLTAGHFINTFEAVKGLVEEGPEHIERLIGYGVQFDLNNKGSVNATIEGGHSHRRVLHINGDQTGKGIMDGLRLELHRRNNIKVIHNAFVTRLILHPEPYKDLHHLNENNALGRTVVGAEYEKDGIRSALYSRFTVLATGGMGDLYTHTTNHSGAYGSGIFLAHEAGAKIQDLRFMQFHPTAFHARNSGRYFLISEAVRGEGAYLLDYKQRRFMTDLHPLAELAPRDVVSQAIFQVLNKGPKDYVYLDTRHLDKDFLIKRFPGIYQHLRRQGYNMGEDLIPVTPVAHYTIGGIVTDSNGRTTMPGLYACGEVASTGVHGANRLASNSLLECLVYGNRAAEAITDAYKMETDWHNIVDRRSCESSCLSTSLQIITKEPAQAYPEAAIQDIIHQTKQLMTKYAGIRRTNEGLAEAKLRFKKLEKQLKELNNDTLLAHECHSRIALALLVTEDALTHDSLGCHYKTKENKEQQIC